MKEEPGPAAPLSCAWTLCLREPYRPPLCIRAASFACPSPSALIMGEGLALKDSIMCLMYPACT